MSTKVYSDGKWFDVGQLSVAYEGAPGLWLNRLGSALTKICSIGSDEGSYRHTLTPCDPPPEFAGNPPLVSDDEARELVETLKVGWGDWRTRQFTFKYNAILQRIALRIPEPEIAMCGVCGAKAVFANLTRDPKRVRLQCMRDSCGQYSAFCNDRPTAIRYWNAAQDAIRKVREGA